MAVQMIELAVRDANNGDLAAFCWLASRRATKWYDLAGYEQVVWLRAIGWHVRAQALLDAPHLLSTREWLFLRSALRRARPPAAARGAA